MTAPRRIVFSADDLGMSPEQDEGIVRATRAGVVREASLCVTGEGAEAALARVASLRDRLGIGLHLSFTFGRALTGAIAGLTDAHGLFHGLGRALVVTAVGLPRREQVEREVLAQLERLQELGVEATHLNGHHHVHVFPVIRDAVLSVASRRRSLHVRVPAHLEPRSPRGATLNHLGRAFARRARQRGIELRTLPCLGLSLPPGDTLESFGRLFAQLDGRPTEWVVHPRAGTGGLDDGGGRLGARAPADELSVLESPAFRALLARHDVQPSSYAEL